MIRDISILYIFIVVLCVSCQQKAAHVFIQQEKKNASKSFETRVEREKRQKEEAEKLQMIELRRKSVTLEEAEQIKKVRSTYLVEGTLVTPATLLGFAGDYGYATGSPLDQTY